MFTKNRKTDQRPPRPRRGRPRGVTAQGEAMRERLYQTSMSMIRGRGYAATTLRLIAKKARVSPGLLYRYFPNKRAVVLELYHRLSVEFVRRASAMPAGTVGARFLFSLRTSLDVLAEERSALAALTPALVGDPGESLFSAATRPSGERVLGVFFDAARGANDVGAMPIPPEDLGWLLYLSHLGCVLFWLLDRSEGQSATREMLGLLENGLSVVSSPGVPPTVAPFVELVARVSRHALWDHP